MNAAGINLTFDLLSAARQDTRLRRSGAYYQGPCPFCGGPDRVPIEPPLLPDKSELPVIGGPAPHRAH